MGKTSSRTFTFTLFVVLFIGKDLEAKEIVRSNEKQNGTDVAAFRPILTKDRLHEIRLYDRMKCFPKILCTLTKSGAFTQLGIVSLNDLADGYLRLLTAFPGGPPSELAETVATFKNDFGGGHSMSADEDGDDGDDVQSESSKTRDENESEELLLSDPLLHHKEKLEMKKLMEEMMAEDRVEAMRKPTHWASTAMSLPFKLGSSLLKEIVVPYFVGDTTRRRRDLDLTVYLNTQNNRNSKAIELDKNQDPITSAMRQWNKLKNPQQCGKVYTACPFESWEVVSMIKLIKDSSVRQ